MTTLVTRPTARPGARVAVVAGRLVGAALLGTMAGIHLHLWHSGYRDIHDIGPMFLANVVVGFGLAIALLLTPGRLNALVAAAGAATMAGSFGALLWSLNGKFFGFQESWKADLVHETLWVEAAGTVVLLLLALAEVTRPVVSARREGAGGHHR